MNSVRTLTTTVARDVFVKNKWPYQTIAIASTKFLICDQKIWTTKNYWEAHSPKRHGKMVASC